MANGYSGDDGAARRDAWPGLGPGAAGGFSYDARQMESVAANLRNRAQQVEAAVAPLGGVTSGTSSAGYGPGAWLEAQTLTGAAGDARTLVAQYALHVRDNLLAAADALVASAHRYQAAEESGVRSMEALDSQIASDWSQPSAVSDPPSAPGTPAAPAPAAGPAPAPPGPGSTTQAF